MKQIFAKESRIECAVVLKSLRDDVISSTHYDPSDPLKNVVLSGVEQELLNSKEILAKRAELLESRIGDVFVKSNENKELTLASRFDKLNSIIKDYYNSDPIVRAYVGPYLNRAIDSINDEFMPVNHEAEQNMVERIKDISEKICTVSADARTEIIAVFDQ